jgi:hypothetical protein
MEMLLLLNTPKEQQIRILLGRTSIGNSRKYRWQPDADAPENKLALLRLISN